MFGLTTSFLNPNILSSLFLHLGSSSTLPSSVALDDGLERPDELDDVDAGDDDRGELRYTLRRPNSRYSELRLNQVPPKSRVTTTSGSIKAPAPMTEDYKVWSADGWVECERVKFGEEETTTDY